MPNTKNTPLGVFVVFGSEGVEHEKHAQMGVFVVFDVKGRREGGGVVETRPGSSGRTQKHAHMGVFFAFNEWGTLIEDEEHAHMGVFFVFERRDQE